jgi:hypothetical protein
MRRLITTGIRIVIIFAFLQLLNFIANDIFTLWPDFAHPYIYYSFLFGSVLSIIFLVILLILCLTWWKAGSIAAFLTGSVDENKLGFNTSNPDFFKIFLRFLGVFFILFTLPIIFGHITYYFSHRGMMNENDIFYLVWWVSDVSRIIIGVWLTLGGRGIVKIINKIWDTASMTGDTDNNKNADASKQIVNQDSKK